MVTGKRRLIAFLATLGGLIAIEIVHPNTSGGLSGNGYMAIVAGLLAYFGNTAMDKWKNGKE